MKNYVLPLAVILGTLGFFSCSNDSDNAELDLTEVNQADVQTVIEINSTISSVDQVIADVNVSNLTNKAFNNAKNECYQVENTTTGYIITFNNCVLNETDNVNGTLEVTYSLNNLTSISSTAVYKDFLCWHN